MRLALALLCFVPGLAVAGSLPRVPGMYAGKGASSAAMAMLDSKIEVTVRGPIVETEVTQTFKNETDDATEATYIFPLPADAAVSAMAIDLGTRKIHAAIEKRAQAQARYEEAVAAGVGAGLLEQERPDVFTQTVSAIPAHGTVTVTLRYDTTARYADGTWELALPLVVAPRYVPGTASGRPTTGSGHNPDTDRSPDASRVTPHATPGGGGRAEIAIAFLTEADQVTSPTHELAHANAHYTITDPKSDHDVLVRWRAKTPTQGWVEAEANGGGFAAALVTGPAATPHSAARCRFVLDRAATTRGDGDTVERALVRALLGALGMQDRAGLATGELSAPAELQKTLDATWAASHAAFDLTRVLAAARPGGAPLVLISDGLVSDDAAAITAAKQLGVAIHVIGIGAAPNRSLLAAIAAATGGTVRFAIAGDDLDAIARDVISDAANPPPVLTVSWGTLAASDVVPGHLPRVGAGQATLVVARVKQVKAANARARGDVFALAAFTAPAAPTGATTPRGAFARRWARLRLDELIAAGDARAITEHALTWGLVSPYTAMVALGDEVVVEGGVKHTRGVPVSLPAGMQWQPVKHETTVDLDVAKEQPKQEPDHVTPKPTTTVTKKSPPHTTTPPPTTPTAPPRAVVPEEDKSAAKQPAHKPMHADDEERTGVAAGGMASKNATEDDGLGDAGEADDNDASVKRAHRREQNAPETIAVMGAAPTSLDYDAVSETSYSGGHYLRFDLALGAGVIVANRDGAFVSTARLAVERGSNTTLIGGEASLWLSRGLDVQGTFAATLTRRHVLPHVDLGAGLGLHLGAGTGPAVDLMMRYALVRPLWLYLRYDAALLFHDGTQDGQHTGTVGIEAHF